MTQDEIAALPAGRELDALVAEKVMGWQWLMDNLHGEYMASIWPLEYLKRSVHTHWLPSTTNKRYADWDLHLPHYSTHMGAAWQVVEKMIERLPYGDALSLDLFQDTGPVYWLADFRLSENGSAVADNAPLAICRAALMAVLL